MTCVTTGHAPEGMTVRLTIGSGATVSVEVPDTAVLVWGAGRPVAAVAAPVPVTSHADGVSHWALDAAGVDAVRAAGATVCHVIDAGLIVAAGQILWGSGWAGAGGLPHTAGARTGLDRWAQAAAGRLLPRC